MQAIKLATGMHDRQQTVVTMVAVTAVASSNCQQSCLSHVAAMVLLPSLHMPSHPTAVLSADVHHMCGRWSAGAISESASLEATVTVARDRSQSASASESRARAPLLQLLLWILMVAWLAQIHLLLLFVIHSH